MSQNVNPSDPTYISEPPTANVDAFQICAELVNGNILGIVDEHIHLKHFDEMRIPCGVKYAFEVFNHQVKSTSYAYDERRDDVVFTQELQNGDCGQEQACYEFDPPHKDRAAGMDKVVKVEQEEKAISESLHTDSESPERSKSRDRKSLGITSIDTLGFPSQFQKAGTVVYNKQLSRQATKRKQSSRAQLQLNEIGQRDSQELKKKADPPEPFYKPVALNSTKTNQDQSFENKVEIMRFQIDIKKQTKENYKKAFKGRKRPNQMDIDGEESSGRPLVTDMKNITFDDNGKTLEVRQCKVERLPQLSGPSAEVVAIKNQHKSSMNVSQKSREKNDASKMSGKPPIQNFGAATKPATTRDGTRNVHTVIASARFSKDLGSGFDNQLDQSSFNIKDNMRATFGAVFSEKNHTDKGPSYADKFMKDGAQKPKLSLEQYQRIYKKSGMMQQIEAKYGDRQSIDYDRLHQTGASDNPPEIISEFNHSNLLEEMHTTMIVSNDYPSIAGGDRNRARMNNVTHENMLSTKSQINRSHIRVHSTKGQRDIISKPIRAQQVFDTMPNNSSNVNNTAVPSPKNSIGGNLYQPEEHLSSLLPTINNKVNMQQQMTRNRSINQSQVEHYNNEKLDRGINTAEERKRVGSAYMNRRPQQHNRVVTAGAEMRKRYNMQAAKSNNVLGGGNSNMLGRQSQMDLAQSSSAYHRQLVQVQMANKEKKDKILPHFVKQSSQGRVSSHMGNRQKYQRLLDKNVSARDTTKIYTDVGPGGKRLMKDTTAVESVKDTASQSHATGGMYAPKGVAKAMPIMS